MKVRLVAAALLTIGLIGTAPAFAGTADGCVVTTGSRAVESFRTDDERARQRTEQMLQRFADQAYEN
jgi:hypothetical protein